MTPDLTFRQRTSRRVLVEGPSLPLLGVAGGPGCKNSAMPALVAASLAPGPVILSNVPTITDIQLLIYILKSLGVLARMEGNEVTINGREFVKAEIAPNLSKRLRGSIYALAIPTVLLGNGRIGDIGGDTLSGRTLEPHARVFSGFGMSFRRCGSGWAVTGGPPRPGEMSIDDHGVSATSMAVILAACAEGRSIIHGASLELETDDVISIVRQLGARAIRYGRTLVIEGPLSSVNARITIPPDHIYYGTIAIASVITGGQVDIPLAAALRMPAVLEKLEETGIKIDRGTTVRVQGRPLRPTNIQTGMFPEFPTDLLPQMMVALALTEGRSEVREGLWKSRFDHITELNRMGSRITVNGNTAKIFGSYRRWNGMIIRGSGIRETAALILAGLHAQGRTEVCQAEALYRGYEDLCGDLTRLGATVSVLE